MYGRDEHRYMQARIDAISEELLHLWDRVEGLRDDLKADAGEHRELSDIDLMTARAFIRATRRQLAEAKANLPAHLIPSSEQSRRTATAVLRSGDLS